MPPSTANSDGLFTISFAVPAANNITFQEKTMKKLQRLCVAGTFTLLLTMSALAGDIQTPGKTQPPPPPESSIPAPGDIQTGNEIQNSVAEIALNLLQTMLSVF
jgi:hypothetical protein